MTSDAWDEELTVGLARHVVGRVDPKELILFDAIAEGGFEKTSAGDRGDGSLGFGIDIGSLSHVALSLSQAVGPGLLLVLGSVATGVASDMVKEPVVKRLKRLFNKEDDDPTAAFPEEALDRARDLVRDRAVELGVEPEQARQIAAIVRSVLGG